MEDLIRRSDAIANIEILLDDISDIQDEDELKEIKAYNLGVWVSLNSIKHHVPSADRPQGEWIDAEIPLESGGSMPIQVCNLCKTFYPLAYTGGGHRFCPNCGCRMKGAGDE